MFTGYIAGPNIKWDVLHALRFCTGRYPYMIHLDTDEQLLAVLSERRRATPSRRPGGPGGGPRPSMSSTIQASRSRLYDDNRSATNLSTRKCAAKPGFAHFFWF